MIRITLIFLLCNLRCFSQTCEKLIERHFDGEPKIIRQYNNCEDSSSFKQLNYYENGQLQSEGFTVNGIQNGLFKSWNQEGVQTAEWNMKDGYEHGFVQCWYDNGIKSKEVFVKQEIRDGLEKTWYKSGSIKAECNYSDGKRLGKCTLYEENGNKKEYFFKNDTLTGPTNEYRIDSTGKVIITIGQYENGLEEGLWKWFDKDSTLTQTSIYKKGIRYGDFNDYYKNGMLRRKGYFMNGKLEGKLDYFDRNGKLTKTEFYREGELTE